MLRGPWAAPFGAPPRAVTPETAEPPREGGSTCQVRLRKDVGPPMQAATTSGSRVRRRSQAHARGRAAGSQASARSWVDRRDRHRYGADLMSRTRLGVTVYLLGAGIIGMSA